MKNSPLVNLLPLLLCAMLHAGDAAPPSLAPFFAPPAEFAHDFCDYRSPIEFADWPTRRAEILKPWHTAEWR